MADNDQYNDEYQFADLDAISPDAMNETQSVEESFNVGQKRKFALTGNIKRNVIIVVVLLILAMVIYKFLGAFFSEKKLPVKPAIKSAPSVPAQLQSPAPSIAQPVQPITPSVPLDSKMQQKLSALEISQQSMRSEVSSVSDQLGGIDSNVNSLASQIAQLNQVISALSAKIEEQSRDIERLMIRTKPKPPPRPVRKVTPTVKYYIQAVIPGRAWLIAQNGSTITVSEGSIVPGYGQVKLIDPQQGRVMTKSGRVIRFSQDDN